jgi:hypothetical protein
MRDAVKTRSVLFAFVAMLALQPHTANARRAKREAGSAFSFAVYGDSRPMMYLPHKVDQIKEIHKLLVEMFDLVLPEKVSEEVVKKHVKLIFDPATQELAQVIMPFETRSEVAYLTVDKGWVTEASVEDVKLLPGVRRTMFRLQGGDWVAREAVRDVQTGRAKFIVNTGDMVWWGTQGRTVADSPYWSLVNDEVLKRLPPPDAKMRAAGLEGRVFTAVGNHEVWGDPDIEGVLSAFPYLKKLGLSSDRMIYKYDFDGVRFIFLYTGDYDYRSPSAWDAKRPAYDAQMKQLAEWLDDAKAKGIRKAFVSFHYPVFARSGMGPIPEPDNPHKLLASYAKDLDLVVFNGHVHTTEIFEVDGVKYLMLGGGGAEQDPILPGRTSVKVPANYPPDLYWNGQPPKEDYNYVLVDVKPGEKTRFTLNRFRPWAAKPFESIELFK